MVPVIVCDIRCLSSMLAQIESMNAIPCPFNSFIISQWNQFYKCILLGWYQTILSCCLTRIDAWTHCLYIHIIHKHNHLSPTQTHTHILSLSQKRIELKDRDVYSLIFRAMHCDARICATVERLREYYGAILSHSIPQNRDERLTSQAYAYIDIYWMKMKNVCESNGTESMENEQNVKVRAQWDAFRFAMSFNA